MWANRVEQVGSKKDNNIHRFVSVYVCVCLVKVVRGLTYVCLRFVHVCVSVVEWRCEITMITTSASKNTRIIVTQSQLGKHYGACQRKCHVSFAHPEQLGKHSLFDSNQMDSIRFHAAPIDSRRMEPTVRRGRR